jgi:hypothetical protein
MRLPQTLTPRPSRLLFAAITAGHFGAAVAVGLTSIAYWGIGLCWLLIAASLGHALRRRWLERPLAIVLRQDGRMEIERAAGEAMKRVSASIPWFSHG